VEHVSIFPMKEAVAVFTALGHIIGARVIFLLAILASFFLTYVHADIYEIVAFDVFVVGSSAALAFASLRIR
jgi:hypothetical protein